LADIVFVADKKTSASEINQLFIKAAESNLKGIIKASDKLLVSTDIIGSGFSATVDLLLTKVIDGDLVRVVAWYDNEWGYVNRLVELAVKASTS